MILVSLMGEQPMPNLLPIRHLRPDHNVLVHTSLEAVKRSSERLMKLLATDNPTGTSLLPVVDAYQVEKIRRVLVDRLQGATDLVFNLTGGTKIMVLGAYEAARNLGARCLYFQTEGPRGRDQRSRLSMFSFDSNGQLHQDQTIDLTNSLITLNDYLQAYTDGYKATGYSNSTGGAFERAVHLAIKDHVDECLVGVRPEGLKSQLEIDLMVRIGNQIGILEVKLGGDGSGKKAVDQLTTAAARESMGTYASRFLVTQPSPSSQSDAYQALAKRLNVRVIVLQDYRPNHRLSPKDEEILYKSIYEHLSSGRP